jgi:hypothetical protein
MRIEKILCQVGRLHTSTASSKADQFLGGGYALLSSVSTRLAAMLPVLVVHNVP